MIYKVYLKNYVKGTASFIGALPERRHGIRRGSLAASALKWARLFFGGLVKDARALFIISIDDRERGASSVEYAILIAVIAAVAVLGIQIIGPAVKSWLEIFLTQWPLSP